MAVRSACAALARNWHSDMCYASWPPRGTMLYALEIPELFGLALGDTEFASTAAAWDALPERMRQHLDGRRAVFDFARLGAYQHRSGGTLGGTRFNSRLAVRLPRCRRRQR